MKSRFSVLVNCISAFLLSICVLWCLASSFDIKVNPAIVLASTTIFSSVFSALSVFSKNNKQFFISLSVIAVVFMLMLVLSSDILISQLNYAVNCVLSLYSTSFDVPNNILFTDTMGIDGNALFVMIGFLLSAVNTVSLVKDKRLIPCTVFCVIFLIPCFVLISTPPAIVPITIIITIFISLYFTTIYRKVNFKIHGAVLIPVACVVLITSLIIYSFIPTKNYKRFEWQDNMLNTAENLLSVFNQKDTEQKDIFESVDRTKNLTEIGPLEYQGIKALEVESPKTGSLYLKGVSYANYSENEWSVLTDEQVAKYPEDFNSFLMTKGTQYFSSIKVFTENPYDVIYSPYYPLTLPDGSSPLNDVLIQNDNGATEYSFKCYSDQHGLYSYLNTEYNDYVNEIYTYLPESTKTKMLEIAEDNGITELDYSLIPDAVKNLVSNKGYYSLNTQKMPEGKDFPVWFLTEAESGYCVHYATAATVMLRALGIPARYVNGYYVSTNKHERTIVTSDNAHAWVEYYDENVGWVVLEATPSSFEPVSGTREDLETIPATEPESTTVDLSEPVTEATQSTANNWGVDPPQQVQTKSDNLNFNYILLIILISLPVLALVLHYVMIKYLRKKHFYSGHYNDRVKYIYRYVKKIKKISHNVIPYKINDIALKSAYSNHRVTKEEVNIMTSYCKEAREEFYRNTNKIKGLFYKFIVVI